MINLQNSPKNELTGNIPGSFFVHFLQRIKAFFVKSVKVPKMFFRPEPTSFFSFRMVT